MKTERYVDQLWHDENNKITSHGLAAMRILITVGLILGLLLGSFVTTMVYESYEIEITNEQ